MNHQEQINHDKHPDESKTRTHRFSKLPDDGDPWAPNNLLTPELKKNISYIPSLWSQNLVTLNFEENDFLIQRELNSRGAPSLKCSYFYSN